MDTLGNLLDKQLTAVMKRESFRNDSNKIDDLDNQLNRLSKEIDDMVDNVLKNKISKEDSIRQQHKTY